MASRRASSRRTVTGALTDLQRRVKSLQNRQNPTRLGNQSVVRSAIQPRAVNSDQLALNAVTNDQIAADAVQREQIDVGAVGTTELGNLAVTNEKLGAFAVTNGKISDEQVDTRVLGPLAVTNAKLNDAAVEERNMTPNSVANASLQLDSVNFRVLDIDAVGLENMLGDSVGNTELRDDSVGNNELQINSVKQNNLQTDSVGFGELQSSSVGNSTLQNGSVTDLKFGGTLSASKIGSGIDGSKITNGTINGASKIQSNTVTSPLISDATRRIIVSSGLTAGFGISKSGNTVSVNTAQIPGLSHRHNYAVQYYQDDAEGRSLRNFTSILRETSTASSKRVKKSISNHEISNPKKLLELNFKKFKYVKSYSTIQNNANREWMHGYLIEDLLDKGFEEVIEYNSEGTPERLNYGLFSALVLELVKVQQEEINSLQDKIKKLEDKK